jgi:hypothetical protein
MAAAAAAKVSGAGEASMREGLEAEIPVAEAAEEVEGMAKMGRARIA